MILSMIQPLFKLSLISSFVLSVRVESTGQRYQGTTTQLVRFADCRLQKLIVVTLAYLLVAALYVHRSNGFRSQ
jgi:hypothetical protein